jgi:hypothetical protein
MSSVTPAAPSAVGPIFLRIRLHHWAAINKAAMGTLTVTTKAMAMTVAMQGGMTLHTDMFCKVKNGVGCRRDSACQCPRHPLSKVAGRTSGQMPK